MKKDHVLFLATRDYVGVGNNFAKSLRAVGVDATALMSKPSPRRDMKHQAEYYESGDEILHRAVEKATIIVWMHSMLTEVPKKLLENKRQVVFHGGTRYRRNFKKMNREFNHRVDTCLIQTGELLKLGAKNPKWILPAIDLETIVPNYDFVNKKKLIIGHFSSRPEMKRRNNLYTKGTSLIQVVMKAFAKQRFGRCFIFQSGGKSFIPWLQNLKRMSKCDIYIESLGQAVRKNTNKHDWSITALEAAALGCVVITNFNYYKRYGIEYGAHGLLIANTKEQLEAHLVKLFKMKREDLIKLKHKAREWVERFHSYKAVGERLKLLLRLDNENQKNEEEIVSFDEEEEEVANEEKSSSADAEEDRVRSCCS